MMDLNQTEFESLALALIAEIPRGKVASYGQIARLIGYPGYGRHVGKACSHSKYYGDYPCHRVVNSSGRLVPHWQEQRMLLEAEGISFTKSGKVDMKKHCWDL